MRYLFFLIVVSIVSCSMILGQDTIMINGVVKDSYTKQQLSYANIIVANSYHGTTSDIYGKFHLELAKTEFPIDLQISFLGYEPVVYKIIRKRNQRIKILLRPKTVDLGEITVNSERNLIFGSKKFQIFDYKIVGDKFVIIMFKNRISKSIIAITNKFGSIINAIPIPGKPVQLFSDCTSELYLITQERPYKILITENKIKLKLANQNQINKLKNPCVGYNGDTYFYQYNGVGKLSVKYYSFNMKSGNYNLFCTVNDYEQQNMFRESTSYLLTKSGKNNAATGNDYDALKQLRKSEVDNFFEKDFMHVPVYAPIFIESNNIFLFDHPNETIKSLDNSGNEIKSVPIKYSELKGWNPVIYKDDFTQKYYTSHVKNGKTTISQIDIKTGMIENKKKINYSWIEKIKIENDTVYFLYSRRDKNSSKYLYFEPIIENNN